MEELEEELISLDRIYGLPGVYTKVYNSLDDVFSNLSSEVVSVSLANTVRYAVLNMANPSFFSKTVPDTPNVSGIAFITYNNKYYFILYRSKDDVKVEEISRDKLEDFVFTPTLYDMNTATVINLEDLLERVKDEK